MIPIILISDDEKQKKKFLDDYVKKNQFPPFLIFKIFPEKEEISINQIREINKQVIYFTQKKRLFILDSFEKSSLEAQNALLKVLEDKINANQFILLASKIDYILPTIRSRAKLIFLKDKENKFVINPTLEKLLNNLIKEDSYNFLTDKLIEKIDSEKAGGLIKQIIIYFSNRLGTNGQSVVTIIKKASQLLKLLEQNNLNPQLTVDNLLIFIKKTYTMK